MRCAGAYTQFKELARNHARSTYESGIARHRGYDGAYGFLAAWQGRRLCSWERVRLESTFAHYQGHLPAGILDETYSHLNLLTCIGLVIGKHGLRHFHGIKQIGGHAALFDMLRLIVNARHPSPAYH